MNGLQRVWRGRPLNPEPCVSRALVSSRELFGPRDSEGAPPWILVSVYPVERSDGTAQQRISLVVSSALSALGKRAILLLKPHAWGRLGPITKTTLRDLFAKDAGEPIYWEKGRRLYTETNRHGREVTRTKTRKAYKRADRRADEALADLVKHREYFYQCAEGEYFFCDGDRDALPAFETFAAKLKVHQYQIDTLDSAHRRPLAEVRHERNRFALALLTSSGKLSDKALGHLAAHWSLDINDIRASLSAPRVNVDLQLARETGKDLGYWIEPETAGLVELARDVCDAIGWSEIPGDNDRCLGLLDVLLHLRVDGLGALVEFAELGQAEIPAPAARLLRAVTEDPPSIPAGVRWGVPCGHGQEVELSQRQDLRYLVLAAGPLPSPVARVGRRKHWRLQEANLAGFDGQGDPQSGPRPTYGETLGSGVNAPPPVVPQPSAPLTPTSLAPTAP
jgi:hypothetical protein